jgi:hypothetical protein
MFLSVLKAVVRLRPLGLEGVPSEEGQAASQNLYPEPVGTAPNGRDSREPVGTAMNGRDSPEPVGTAMNRSGQSPNLLSICYKAASPDSPVRIRTESSRE